jgi:hypothetical protein
MFAVSPFEVVYNIKKQPLWPTTAAWVAACRLLWAMTVGLTIMGHGG